jgi:hypothetical protein
MDNQSTLDQHHAIFVATLDYLLEKAATRVIVDQHDRLGEDYEKLKQKAEKHYRNGNLQLLQRVMREIAGLSPMFRDESFLAYMKDRTGYEAEIVKQSLPAGLSKHKRNEVTLNDPNVSRKMLAELISPDNKRKIIVHETSKPPDLLITSVDLQFEKSGASVYTVNGVDLDLNVYWKDNNTVIIETRAAYIAISRHGERYQSLDDVVRVEYVVR